MNDGTNDVRETRHEPRSDAGAARERWEDVPVPELRRRAQGARRALREVRSQVAGGDLGSLQDVLDHVAAVLPVLEGRQASTLDSAVRGLPSPERRLLRLAIDAEAAARERVARMLGDIPAVRVDRALARAEEHEALMTELRALLALFDHALLAPPTAPCLDRAGRVDREDG